MSSKIRTHTEIIDLPNGGRAIVTGVPNDHECDDNGDVVMTTVSGLTVTWCTIRKWAHLTSEARRPLLYKHFEDLFDPINSESTSCSICHSSARDSWRDYDF